MKKIISYLLAFVGIGIISCQDDDPIAEYGCPYAEFELKGNVTDTNHVPVNQIRIVVNSEAVNDTLFSDSNGVYDKTYNITPWDKTYFIKVQDIDSAENGGNFIEQTKTIQLTEDEFNKLSGGWYAGKVTKTIDFTLLTK